MDAVGATASIVGIITAALQSTKFIYQIIERIKDAPTVIKELGEKVKVLEGALLRMSNIQLPSQLLKDRMEKCQRDLESFSKKVQKISDAFNGESRSNKLRKGFQVWFKEDKFMNSALDEYRQFFILEMSANTMEASEKYGKYGIPYTSSKLTTAIAVADTSVDHPWHQSISSGRTSNQSLEGFKNAFFQRIEILLPVLLKEDHACHPNNGDNGNQRNAQIDGLETSIDRIVNLYNETETTIY
ncbi:hypothetical protein FPQ18DRAFT_380526 [Pyronema domesticum]|uniref:Azaphilone pigments biosynthesis cluster protein L N-terminal domain-containing protein n=1 Tax=Pyronema omphalodes (strain CBS 100304) TaxID=1076935 RepID=U4L2J2_PYROM|nr:hypothetical protein FPQ18DRAFT_380526 [Pyronema domesticum]CCX04290.1 Similar to predicted protein [Nectria haematococca mpVI 77-13-4]; acc. no. XP_003044550 [Pyronema omphalodes CBS 100304]